MEIAPGLWRIELSMPRSFMRSVNAYLLRDRAGYVLVDCGLEADHVWEELREQLARVGVAVESVHTILATHAHPDHLGLAARLQRSFGAQLWLHRDDVEFLRQRYDEWARYRDLLRAWMVRYGFPPDEASEVVSAMEDARPMAASPRADRVLGGGEELTVGEYRFEALWTPGHTPGHLCLYDPHRELLLCGDHILQHVAPNVSLQPYGADNPMPGYLGSLEYLRELPIRLALPGHGHPFAELAGRAGQVLRQQLERREQLLGLLDSRPRTAYQLAGEIWATTTPLNWSQFRGHLRRNAVGTLATHLELLAEEGRARRLEAEVVAFVAPR